jgi:hypothetical protein
MMISLWNATSMVASLFKIMGDGVPAAVHYQCTTYAIPPTSCFSRDLHHQTWVTERLPPKQHHQMDRFRYPALLYCVSFLSRRRAAIWGAMPLLSPHS